MKSLGFIMTRHVNSELTNNYWKECYLAIRRFYPLDIVMIIDDDSDPDYIDSSGLNIENCFFVRSEFPRCGEFLAYYYFYKFKLFEKAVILHDSVFFQKRVDFDEIDGCRFLWHFERHSWDIEEIEIGLLSKLKDPEKVIAFYHEKKKWNGCFGLQMVCSLNWLDTMETTYGLLNLVHHIQDRTTRSCMERVIGCIATYHDHTLIAYTSLYGSIFRYLIWGYDYDTYQREKDTVDYVKKLPLIKIWTSR